MRILTLLSYYRPHISGLTLTAAHTAEEFAAGGHQVTVLTSRHDPALPEEEVLHGVRIVRAGVAIRVSKGVVLRGYARRLWPLVRTHDVVLVHVPAAPQESLWSVAMAGLAGKPLVMEYACDVRLPGGAASRMVEFALGATHWIAGRSASAVVALSEDYARSSPVLGRLGRKLVYALPAIRISQPCPVRSAELRRRLAPGGEAVIGIAARMAADKGFGVLLDAIPLVRREFPGIVVAHAGAAEDVIGEELCRRTLRPRIEALGDTWKSLGVLSPDLADFYAACDLLVLPSINRTESFGMVQVEAMLCGTPVVASDLPGVRIPVTRTGMGRLVKPGDAAALAGGILDVLASRNHLLRSRNEVEQSLGLADAFRIRRDLLCRLVQ